MLSLTLKDYKGLVVGLIKGHYGDELGVNVIDILIKGNFSKLPR